MFQIGSRETSLRKWQLVDITINRRMSGQRLLGCALVRRKRKDMVLREASPVWGTAGQWDWNRVNEAENSTMGGWREVWTRSHEFGFYWVVRGQQRVQRLEGDVIWVTFWKDHCGCLVESFLVFEEQKQWASEVVNSRACEVVGIRTWTCVDRSYQWIACGMWGTTRIKHTAYWDGPSRGVIKEPCQGLCAFEISFRLQQKLLSRFQLGEGLDLG